MKKFFDMIDVTGFSEKEKSSFTSERTIKLLFELTIACLGLLVIRVWRAHSFGYLFLVWNLFLAWIPFLISRYVLEEFTLRNKFIKNIFTLAIWWAFLPNAPYILTDLFHLHQTSKIPMWYDLIVILSFAFTGMLLFYISILDVERKVFPKLNPRYFRWTRLVLFLGVGYGIYLGRYLRFNSWDIVSAPGELFRSMYHSVFSGGIVKESFGVTLFFAVFLYFGYKIFFLLTDKKIC